MPLKFCTLVLSPFRASDFRSVSTMDPPYREGDVVEVRLSIDPNPKCSPFVALGLVRYIGPLKGMRRSQSANDNLNLYAGIELISPIDNAHSGTLEGRRYFECSEQHGILIPLRHIVRALSTRDLFEELRRWMLSAPCEAQMPAPATHPLLDMESTSFMHPIRESNLDLDLVLNHTTEYSTLSSRTPSALRSGNMQTPSFTPTRTPYAQPQPPQGFVFTDYDESAAHPYSSSQPHLKLKAKRSKSKRRRKRKERLTPFIDGAGPDTPTLSHVTNDGVLSQNPYAQVVAKLTVDENEPAAVATAALDAYGLVEVATDDDFEYVCARPAEVVHGVRRRHRQAQPVPRMDPEPWPSPKSLPRAAPRFHNSSKSLPPRRHREAPQPQPQPQPQAPPHHQQQPQQQRHSRQRGRMARPSPGPSRAYPAQMPSMAMSQSCEHGPRRAAKSRKAQRPRPKTIGTVTFAPRRSK